MKTQRKRIISLLLAMIMVFTMIPATAFAETAEAAETDLYEVTVNVAPSTANATFYEGEDAKTPLSEEAVTDNGVVNGYHQYIIKVEKGLYSYRGTDGDTDLGGMSFGVPFDDEIMYDPSTGGGVASGEGLVLNLRRANYYTTNKAVTAIGDYTLRLVPSGLADVVNGAQYIDSSSRVVTPVLVLARGNALVYQGKVTLKDELAESYAVNNITNATFSKGTSAQNKTFSLATVLTYTVTAPAAAKVQAFNQLNNFNVEELQQHSETKNEDGTVTHVFKGVGLNNTYRVTMDGKITRAGYFASKAEDIVITYDENEDQTTTVNDVEQAAVQKRMESSTLVNVNGQNNLKLASGETFRLRAYRGAWQIINSDTANIMIEPDFNYEIISGGEHIEMTPAANKCTGNAGTGDASNWMDIKGVSAGTAIIEVSYDAIKIAGDGTSYDGLYGATDPQRKSLIVINVGETGNTLSMTAEGSSNNWDTEYDTVYFTGETGEMTFTAALGEDVPDKVELSVDKGKTWTTVEGTEGKYTAKGLVGGNNILKFTKGNTTEYQVVRAAKVTYTVENTSRDADYILEGDTVKIVFDGLYTPVSKFSGIYNPGFGQGHKVQYTLPEGFTQTATGGQYDFISTNTYSVTLAAGGNVELSGGNIAFNVMGVSDPLGGHRVLTDNGVGTNFSAVSTQHTRSVLPTLEFEVVAMKSIPVTINTGNVDAEITVTDEDGETVTPEDGVYTLDYGEYDYVCKADGYAIERGSFSVTHKDGDQKEVSIEMRKIEGGIWDGSTTAEPKTDENGVYQIGTGAELAWFAEQVNAGTGQYYNAKLTADISLGGFDWTPIGGSEIYYGTFDGDGHYVKDLYINSTDKQQGLFGTVGYSGTTYGMIKNLGVKGTVTSTGNNVAAIVGQLRNKATVQNCVNNANVTGYRYVGGIVGYQYMSSTISNCYNTGDITATYNRNAGGISGGYSTASIAFTIENCYSTGEVTATSNAGGITYNTKATSGTNNYYLDGACSVTTSKVGTETAKADLMAMAETLGDAYLDNPTSYNGGYPILAWEESKALVVAQEEAAAELDAYKNAEDYRTAEQNQLADIIANAKKAIEEATAIADVVKTVNEAKTAMDALKTDAQYTAEELAAAKEAAKTTVKEYKDAADYREAEATVLAGIIEETISAIEAAAVIGEVQPIVDAAKADMDAVKTDAQLTAEELAAAKEEAKKEVAEYKDPSVYREEQQKELEKAIEAANDAIDAVETIDKVAPEVEAAKAVMDAIKTNDQLTAEELASAKAEAKETVEGYKNVGDYREAEQAKLAEIIVNAVSDIDAATVIDEIQPIVDAAKEAMDALETDEELAAEELAAAQAEADAVLDSYDNFDDYRVAEKAELLLTILIAKQDIKKAESAAEANAILKEAVEKIDAIKTDAELDAEGILSESEAAMKAQQAAEAAKAEAEAAQQAAEKAKAETEGAQQAAEKAQAEAEAAKQAAEEALAKAEDAQKAAEAAKADASATKEEVEKLAAEAEAEKEAAEAATAKAETAQQAAEEAQTEAEAAKQAAEKAQAEAEAAKQAAEEAKAEAERIKDEITGLIQQAETEKEKAEAAQQAAEKAQAEAEAAQKEAEEAARDANTARDEVEKLKAQAEVEKAEAEAAQAEAEAAQAAAEAAQKAAEAAMSAAEEDRIAAEEAQAAAEVAQKAAEAAQAAAEAALQEAQAVLAKLNEVKQLDAPTNVKVKNVAKTGKLIVTWKAVEGADEYAIYRAKSKNGAYRKIFVTTGTKYTNTYATAGTTYYYKVKAVSDSKTVENSEFSKIVKRTCDLKRPVVTAKSKTKKQIKLTWKKVKGADKYVVYRATSKNGTYKRMFTTKKLSFTNKGLKSGKTYYYKVKAVKTNKAAANSAFSIVDKVKCK